MAVEFDGTTQYLKYVTFPPVTVGFTVGIWSRLPGGGAIARGLFSFANQALPDHYMSVYLSSAEQISIGGDGGVGGVAVAVTTSPGLPAWVFVVGRFISTTSRRISMLTSKGVFGTNSTTATLNPSGMDAMTLSGLVRSSGVTRFNNGAIAEFWMVSGDVGRSTGSDLTISEMSHLAYNGPFNNTLIRRDRILEYKGFRASPTGEGGAGDEYISGKYKLENIGGATLGPHVPLPYYHKRPDHSKLRFPGDFRFVTDTQTRLILRRQGV